MAPALSIVTVCLDDREGLARTLESVERQGFRDLELLVVDGGSTDGSLEVVRAHAPRIARWVSERDGGVYEAQNKGAAMAGGTWLLFLNAGDHLAADDALERLFAGLGADEPELVYCDVLYEKGGAVRRSTPPARLLLPYLLRSTLCTQATLFRRSTFARLGGYDTSLRIVADYDLMMRILLAERGRARKVPVTLAVHRQDGLSTRPENAERVARERELVQARWLPAPVRELHADWLALRERTPARRLRALFRPLARLLRDGVRRLRGRAV